MPALHEDSARWSINGEALRDIYRYHCIQAVATGQIAILDIRA